MEARLFLTCHCFFFFNDTATTEIYTLSLHDALPILFGTAANSAVCVGLLGCGARGFEDAKSLVERSEEHTSELQSRFDLVCRLLLEKKKRDVTPCLFCAIL